MFRYIGVVNGTVAWMVLLVLVILVVAYEDGCRSEVLRCLMVVRVIVAGDEDG